jgi:hypothetical protein
MILTVLIILTHASGYAENNMVISNVTGTGVTLSWWDDTSGICKINYGLSPGSYTLTAYDIRGSKTNSNIHYVDITGLIPKTTYYYQVIVNDNEYHYGTFTTKSSVIPSGSIFAYGRIYAGEVPVSGAIVYIQVKDTDSRGSNGYSSIGSCITDDNGYWYYDLVNLRVEHDDMLFCPTSGDVLYIDVYSDEGINASTCVSVSACMPVEDIYLR